MTSDPKYPDYTGSTNVFDQAINRIAKAVSECRVEFLFGSGMSKTSNVPLGHDLNLKLLDGYFPSSGELPHPSQIRMEHLAHKYPLEILSEAATKKPGARKDFARELHDCLFGELRPCLYAHEVFEGICFWDAEPRVQQIFTTNFDDLLEKQFGGLCCRINLDNAHELSEVLRKPQIKIPIIYLHGNLDGEYVVTESSAVKARDSTIMTAFQHALDTADAFVFVGYSLNDLDFRIAYLEHREKIKARSKGNDPLEMTTFVVSPPDDEYDYELGRKIWGSRGALWIPLDALGFFQKLRRCLEHNFGEMQLKDLKSKFQTADETVLAEKRDRITEILAVGEGDALQFMFLSKSRTGGM